MTHPLPSGVAAVTVTGRYIDPEGNPLSGTVTFTPPTVLTLPGAHTVSATSAVVTLDTYGMFSVALIATDNAGMSPTGWTYQVVEQLSGLPVRQYSVFLPQSPSAVDISEISPALPYSGRYLPVVGPAGPAGPAGAAGPAGTPTTVNGHTGSSITLTAADVGADASGAAAAAVVTAEGYTDTKMTAEVTRANGAYLLVTDPAVTNSRPPTGAAGGDLSGTYPSPSVARIAGVAVSGTPAYGQSLVATSGSAAAWRPQDASVFDVRAYGAVGNGKVATDGAMTAGSAVLACVTSAGFVAGDVGKAIMVKGADNTAPTTLVTTISGFTDSGHVTLAATAATTVTGATVMWATDDTAAFVSAVSAAVTYAQAHSGAAKVVIPAAAGQFYGIAGPLVSGGTTKGNAQIPIPIVAATGGKVALTIEGVVNGSGLQHWQQTVPQLSGSTLVSFGVFASASAQVTSINAAGNPCVIGGPSQPGGYGVAPGVFSNMLVTLRNFSVLTTHSLYGLTYSAADLSGVGEANVFDFAYGTTGNVPANDFAVPNQFAIGLSVGLLMPANGNNDNNACRNVSVHGGYTYGFFATEHTVVDTMRILYCWSAFCPVGVYYNSVGATHAIYAAQLSIEGCVNELYIVGVGSAGIGPFVDIVQLDTEASTPTFADNSAGAALAAALGTIKLTGLYTPANVNATHPTGLRIVNGQSAYPVTRKIASYAVSIIDEVVLVDATAGSVTVTLISAVATPNTYTVKKVDASANTVTVAAAAGQTIDGAATRVLSAQWSGVKVVPQGGNWYTV